MTARSVFPVAVAANPAEARESAARLFAGYGSMPSYRAALDGGGYSGPGDVAIIGNEMAVERQLADLAEIGVTDFLGTIFPVAGDSGARARTYELLAAIARG